MEMTLEEEEKERRGMEKRMEHFSWINTPYPQIKAHKGSEFCYMHRRIVLSPIEGKERQSINSQYS